MTNRLLLVLKLVFSVGLAALFYSQADLNGVSGILKEAVPAYLVLGLVLNYFGGITSQSMITLMTSNDLSASLRRMDAINLGLRFYAMILPMLAVSVIRWHRYTKLGCSKVHAVFLMLLNKSLQNLIIAAVLLSGFVIYFELFSERLGSTAYLLLFSTALVLAATLILVLVFTNQIPLERYRTFFTRIAERLPSKLRGYSASKAKRVEETITVSQTINRREFFRLIALSVGSFILIVASQYSLALALGLHVPLLVIAFARSWVQLLMMLPLSIGGVGVRELGFISGLGAFGVPMEVALALSLLLLFVQLILAALGGALEAWGIFSARRASSNSGS